MNKPVAWIVTKGDLIFHFSVIDGWNVEVVLEENIK